jgi:hypothetical protein
LILRMRGSSAPPRHASEPMRKATVTALARIHEAEPAAPEQAAPAAAKPWRFRAIVDAFVLIAAFAGSWAVVALATLAMVKLF